MKFPLYLLRKAILLLHRAFFGNVRHARLLGVQVGDGCRIYSTRFGSEPFLIRIGDRVTITSGVTFLTHDGSTWLVRDKDGRRYFYGRISIGSDVFIGVNAIIMPGVEIGSRVIVGAGSVVTRSIPDGTIVAGVPAKFIGWFDDYAKRAIESFPSEKTLAGARLYHERVSNALEPMRKPDIETPPRP